MKPRGISTPECATRFHKAIWFQYPRRQKKAFRNTLRDPEGNVHPWAKKLLAEIVVTPFKRGEYLHHGQGQGKERRTRYVETQRTRKHRERFGWVTKFGGAARFGMAAAAELQLRSDGRAFSGDLLEAEELQPLIVAAAAEAGVDETGAGAVADEEKSDFSMSSPAGSHDNDSGDNDDGEDDDTDDDDGDQNEDNDDEATSISDYLEAQYQTMSSVEDGNSAMEVDEDSVSLMRMKETKLWRSSPEVFWT
ncbi:hypothetical protein BGX23_003249 [Mortierella sp. AD031]|nr:hypothetical protein BGX23_003249 [Mortierella sp. AD031]